MYSAVSCDMGWFAALNEKWLLTDKDYIVDMRTTEYVYVPTYMPTADIYHECINIHMGFQILHKRLWGFCMYYL